MSKRKSTNRPVKLSKEVLGWISKRKLRKGEKNVESFDAFLRRFFGLPSRKGEPQELKKYYVLPNEGEPLIFLNKAEARGAAVIRAVRRGTRKAEPVLTVRGNAE
jgi:hypothetical protein